jgi:hypothetical protein
MRSDLVRVIEGVLHLHGAENDFAIADEKQSAVPQIRPVKSRVM